MATEIALRTGRVAASTSYMRRPASLLQNNVGSYGVEYCMYPARSHVRALETPRALFYSTPPCSREIGDLHLRTHTDVRSTYDYTMNMRTYMCVHAAPKS